jgi:hypothetical protein
MQVLAPPAVEKAALGGSSSDPDIDDGGCDLGIGYFVQSDLRKAMGSGVVSSQLHAQGHLRLLPEHVLRLPAAAQSRLGAYSARAATNDSVVTPLIPCHVMTSRLMGLLTPLRNQNDFINSMQQCQSAVSQLEGLLPVADLSKYGISGCVERHQRCSSCSSRIKPRDDSGL